MPLRKKDSTAPATVIITGSLIWLSQNADTADPARYSAMVFLRSSRSETQAAEKYPGICAR